VTPDAQELAGSYAPPRAFQAGCGPVRPTRAGGSGAATTARRRFALAPADAVNAEPEVRDTLLHEIAHALCPGDGHAAAVRAKCRELGARPAAATANQAVASPPRRAGHRYEWGCPLLRLVGAAPQAHTAGRSWAPGVGEKLLYRVRGTLVEVERRPMPPLSFHLYLAYSTLLNLAQHRHLHLAGCSSPLDALGDVPRISRELVVTNLASTTRAPRDPPGWRRPGGRPRRSSPILPARAAASRIARGSRASRPAGCR